MFASPIGQPINPRTDYSEWKRLLKDAGLREARLHDARHTTATVLLVLRQPTPTVMSLMGWSSESMAARYQHVTDTMRSQVASQVGGLIWDSPGGNDDQAPVTVRRGSLAAVLAAAEQCVMSHPGGTSQRPELRAALADLRAYCRRRRPRPEQQMRPKLRPGGLQKDERQLPAQDHAWSVAVEVGFEPTEDLRLHTLSRRAPSATRRLHRRRAYPTPARRVIHKGLQRVTAHGGGRRNHEEARRTRRPARR